MCGLAGQCGGGSVGTPATILAKLGEESQLRPCSSHSQRGKGTERMSIVKTSDLCKVARPVLTHCTHFKTHLPNMKWIPSRVKDSDYYVNYDYEMWGKVTREMVLGCGYTPIKYLFALEALQQSYIVKRNQFLDKDTPSSLQIIFKVRY